MRFYIGKMFKVESTVMWTADSLKAMSRGLLLWSSMQNKVQGHVGDSCEKLGLDGKCKWC